MKKIVENIKYIADLFSVETDGVYIKFEDEFEIVVYKLKVVSMDGVDVRIHLLPDKASLISTHVELIHGDIAYTVELRYSAKVIE